MKKDGEIDYDRESDVFPSLILLLKAKSSHFVDVINSKVSYPGIHSITHVSTPLISIFVQAVCILFHSEVVLKCHQVL